MGTESKKTQHGARGKPPPVPPRPNHLLPPKMITQYSSMPDILSGKKKDLNPDLIKRFNYTDNYYYDDNNDDSDYYQPLNTEVKYITRDMPNNFPKIKEKHRFSSNCDLCPREKEIENNHSPKGKPVTPKKSFSCIPSRSNSKKKKNVPDTTIKPEIRQTSWYIEDEGNNSVELSKYKIALNSCSNVDFSCEKDTNSPYPVTTITSHSRQRQRRNYPIYMASSSSSLSGLPPLPKSLSDASHMWDKYAKKVPNTFGSSRSGIHPKVPPPPPPIYASNSSQEHHRTNMMEDRRLIPPPPPPRKPTSLDMKLAILRKEMYDLRQMDLSLLNQLWSLNESIHDFRQLQESLSPQTPSSHSSDEEEIENFYTNIGPIMNAPRTSTIQNSFYGSNSSRSSAGTSHSNNNIYTDL